MPLSAGDRLGPYEIVSPIGAGGMGEVYKARDPRLDRTVALKVSKAEFTARFAQEARTVAQLNHPYVCTLYDVGPNYLVMEFVEGQPLQGPLPIEKALEYAGQILDALDAAHRKGIVHRDLKPGNILVTKQGIKLLDFGLAKQGASSGLSADDVTMAALSVEGQISGTLQYMAPEQLEGRPADPRSDIFAFGLVLYELITGQRPFTGPSQASVIASILKEQARPLRELQPLTPPGLEPVLQTCLEKDPDKRWQSAREVKHALDWMSRQTMPDAPVTPTKASTKGLRLWQGAAALLALVAVGLAVWTFWPRTAPPAQITHFQVPVPENVNFYIYLSVSPDGRKLAFIATGAQEGLWIRDLDALEWRRLPGTEGAVSPFWSPDNRFVGFTVQNQLKKIDISGGPAQTLCTVPGNNLGSGTWNRDGVIVFGGRDGSPLWKVSQAGGVPTALTVLDPARGERFHALPAFLPDGKHFLYFRQGRNEIAGVYTGSIDLKPADQPRERILATTFSAHYANNNVFFMRDNTLMAQPFDASRLQLRGEPVPVAENVATTGAVGIFSVSPAGTLVWRGGARSTTSQLTWFDRQGKVLSTFGQPNTDQFIALSPDGSHGVVRDTTTDKPGDLWTLDFARGVRTRLTFRRALGSGGVWSPDGSRIAFMSGGARDTIYEKSASGAGDDKELMKQPGIQLLPTDWSRDGRFLLYYAATAKTGTDVFVLPLEGDRKPVELLSTEFNELEPVFSPDMRWIAYASNESGRYEIYVRPFTASGPAGAPALGAGKWQISRDGGAYPRWTGDGKEIIFEAISTGATTSVAVKANGSAFEAGIPERLFLAPQVLSDFGWDVTADRKRVLVNMPQGSSNGPAVFDVVLNWPALLKKN